MRIMIIFDTWSSLNEGEGNIIDELLNSSYEVVCMSPGKGTFNRHANDYKKLMIYNIPQSLRKHNLNNLKFVIHCLMAYHILKPDKILLYLNKQTTVLSLVLRFFRNAHVSFIIGSLNFLNGKKGFLYRMAFKFILSHSETVFFVYKGDYDLIDRYKLGCKIQAVVLKSHGVDLDAFLRYPLPKTDLVYMAMPLLCCHGVRCFIETARLVRKKYPKVRFLLSGTFVDDPRVLTAAELDEACESGAIYYIEEVNDIRPYLEVCSIFMQPNLSVREGYITEAEAAGRPILASAHPVNRGLLVEGYNGFTLPVHDAKKWAEKIMLLIENKQLKTNMADYSRELCVRWHDRRKVNKIITEKMKNN